MDISVESRRHTHEREGEMTMWFMPWSGGDKWVEEGILLINGYDWYGGWESKPYIMTKKRFRSWPPGPAPTSPYKEGVVGCRWQTMIIIIFDELWYVPFPYINYIHIGIVLWLPDQWVVKRGEENRVPFPDSSPFSRFLFSACRIRCPCPLSHSSFYWTGSGVVCIQRGLREGSGGGLYCRWVVVGGRRTRRHQRRVNERTRKSAQIVKYWMKLLLVVPFRTLGERNATTLPNGAQPLAKPPANPPRTDTTLSNPCPPRPNATKPR